MKFDLFGRNKQNDDEYDEDDYPEDGDYYDDEEDVDPDPKPAPAPNYGARMSTDNGKLEMKLVKPERYDSTTAQKIADHLLNDRTVVLNLESTSKEAAKRLIDFLSGVVYSVDGNISRVSANTVVIVPNNVNVSGEQFPDQNKKEEFEDEE